MTINNQPQQWGLTANGSNQLTVRQFSTLELAETYGTPLHVINQPRLVATAEDFRKALQSGYPGKVAVHYPFKCNSVPTVIQSIRSAGCDAEVMTPFELDLALHLGFRADQIIVNGPCKTADFLRQCLDHRVRLIVIDSAEELFQLNQLAGATDRKADVLFRINPDYTPRGINTGAATGNRRHCAFGLDLKSGEAVELLKKIKDLESIIFQGFHFHIGTGIMDPADYSRAIKRLFPLFRASAGLKLPVKIFNCGGGFAAPTTREFTTGELLRQQVMRFFPKGMNGNSTPHVADFIHEISLTLTGFFGRDDLPQLIMEPGRCITSQNQFLLLTVQRVKNRPGVGRWLVTDGGLGTCTLPTYYEYHELFLCNQVTRPIKDRATIIGPCCFAADTIYKDKPMPAVNPGELLAIMDTGAYFNQMESTFGFSRPAIAGVRSDSHFLARHADTFSEMTGRDHYQI